MEFSLPDIIFGRRWKAAAEWLPEGFRLRRIYTDTLMMMKITLVAVILIILLLPLIFDKKTKLDRSKPGLGNARMPAAPRYKPPRYNGPKTDERINSFRFMLLEGERKEAEQIRFLYRTVGLCPEQH